MNGLCWRFLLLATLIFPAISAPETAQADGEQGEWPQFLGPHRNGISDETGLLTEWPEAGPKLVWRAPGGVGMSGLTISRGRLVTMVQRDGKQRVVSLDVKSGKTVWQTPVAPAYKNGMGNGPRATPAISGNQVFVFTGEGILAALDFADGSPLWSHNVVNELKGTVAEYGMASSPLVIGSTVVVTAGVEGASVVAYDTKSGKLAWKSGDDAAGYSSAALLQLSGRKQLVVYTGEAAVGLVPETGTPLWRFPFETNFFCNIVTPIAFKDQVFISSGENHGCVMLSFQGTDAIQVKEEWKSLGSQSVLRNEWQTSILADGHLYGFDNVGAAGPVSHLTCVNAETGKRVWQKLRFGKGNLIAADGKLFISTMAGELVAVRLTPRAYEELGRTTLIGTTRQAPALSNGQIYLRDDDEIVCVDVRGKQ
ncbi:MAG: PQQ-binding-like beta-propeller repeat protein [Planctomycetes bacterium]|nr:PQQ-binding-like beta-propeller repeat protein [Planctomycetota bacterium]